MAETLHRLSYETQKLYVNMRPVSILFAKVLRNTEPQFTG